MVSQCDFECDKFDDEFVYPMAAEKEFTDSKFLLDVCTMKEHLDKDINIQRMVKRTDIDYYMIKEVEEGVFWFTMTI